ncbi:MAG: ATP-dependent helicase, partial [Actinomycetes bacterium]
MTPAKYSATEIFQALIDYEQKKFGQTKIFLPTPEQILIIESDPTSPSVVIAGAGSGKTETMGARVLWLVANGFVRPDEILGLTFTRKAAGELALRIRRRLRLLQKVKLLPVANNDNPIDLAVTVSTYHSYAGKIVSEHGIRMGIDSGTEPMGQAATWQIINDIVSNFETTDYELTHGVNDIIKKVASLAGQIGEHASSTQAVRDHALMQLEKLLTTNGRNDDVRLAITSLEEQISILPMVDQLDQYRRSNGTLSFDDQMSLAAELAVTFDEIGTNERSKYRIVLLDEYQDTSFGQVRFLSHLFKGGHPVTAVGDPNQAIYGWRSASPETIGNFPRHFPSASGTPVVTYKLLTTFRNDEQV